VVEEACRCRGVSTDDTHPDRPGASPHPHMDLLGPDYLGRVPSAGFHILDL
jgi:hypothetical protein